MSKVAIIAVSLLLVAIACNQKRSNRRGFVFAACALAFCLPHMEAQTERTDVDKEHESRFDLGVHLTGLIGGDTRNSLQGGAGLRGTFYLNEFHFLALDAEINHSFSKTSAAVARGGNLTQVLIGPKINLMVYVYDEHFGPFDHFYIKARPGFVSWSNSVIGLGLAPPAFPGGTQATVPTQFGRTTIPALDLGISLEAPLAKRFAWHVDLGDTLIFARQIMVSGTAMKAPGVAKSNFEVTTGILYRF
jgi:hypothetical protein